MATTKIVQELEAKVGAAQAALSKASGVLQVLDDEIGAEQEKLQAIEDLDSITQADLLERENAQRAIRRLKGRRQPLVDEVTGAEGELAAARRQLDQACFDLASREALADADAVTREIRELGDKLVDRLTKHQELVLKANRMDPAGDALSQRVRSQWMFRASNAGDEIWESLAEAFKKLRIGERHKRQAEAPRGPIATSEDATGAPYGTPHLGGV